MNDERQPITEAVWFCREGRDGWRLLFSPEDPGRCASKLHGTNLCGANATSEMHAGIVEPDSRCHPCDARPGVVVDAKTAREQAEAVIKYLPNLSALMDTYEHARTILAVVEAEQNAAPAAVPLPSLSQ